MKRIRTARWLKVLSLCLLTGMFVGCATVANVSKSDQAVDPIDERAEKSPQIVNILLLGVDSWDTLSGRSDAIVILSIDVDHKRVLVTSVPRDLRVSLDGLPQPQRINAAYAYGGANLARTKLEDVLDVEIPYYAVVNFSGFARIVDTLGGVTLDVPNDINDMQFPAADGVHYEPFVLKAGVQHLDGETALKYARTRKSSPNGDFGRMYRQQQVMHALKAQALTPRTLPRIPALYNDFRHAVNTNISLQMLVRLARVAGSVDAKSISSYAIDEASGLVTAHYVDGVFVLEPDLAGIRAALHERIGLLSEEAPQVAQTASP